jgi:GNAT superfamily N-acetyltransferase
VHPCRRAGRHAKEQRGFCVCSADRCRGGKIGDGTMIVRQASIHDAPHIAVMVKELTDEIIDRTGARHFHVHVDETAARCRRFLDSGLYDAYLAIDGAEVIGFVALCESHALYAEGTFGIIQELYVRAAFRRAGTGGALVEAAKEHARKKRWTRLELCTPPVPEFEPVVSFYDGHGFSVTGGRKMKCPIDR